MRRNLFAVWIHIFIAFVALFPWKIYAGAPEENDQPHLTSSWEATYFLKHPVTGAHLGTRVVSMNKTASGWTIQEHQLLLFDQESLEHYVTTVISSPPECRLVSTTVETRVGGTLLSPSRTTSQAQTPNETSPIPMSVLALLSSQWIADSGLMDKSAIAERPTNIQGRSTIHADCVVIKTRRCRDDRMMLLVLTKKGREIAIFLLDEDGRATHEITAQTIAIRSDQAGSDKPIPEELMGLRDRILRDGSKKLPRIFD